MLLPLTTTTVFVQWWHVYNKDKGQTWFKKKKTSSFQTLGNTLKTGLFMIEGKICKEKAFFQCQHRDINKTKGWWFLW